MVKAARDRARRREGRATASWPRYTYAVGTSNGGYQVRRAIETAPKLFDGGVDWEGTFVDAQAPNLLTDLPPAILNFPDYVGFGLQSEQHGGEEHPRAPAIRPTSSTSPTVVAVEQLLGRRSGK